MASRTLQWSAMLLFICANASASESREDPLGLYPIEEKLIDHTNRQRARYGVAPLKMSTELVSSARQHTALMCRTGNFVHTSSPVAENIAMGQESVPGVIQAWMNSTGHRANMLNPNYTRIGVAAYRLDEGGRIYWCQQFLR